MKQTTAVAISGGVDSLMTAYLLKESLTVFTFHDVSDNPSDFCKEHLLNTPLSTFEDQIKLINSKFNLSFKVFKSRKGFQVIKKLRSARGV